MPNEIVGLVVKIVQRCNLNCSYCYMYQHVDQSYRTRPNFMSEEIFSKMITRVAEYCDRRPDHRMEIIFHGGEPMLIGPKQLDRFAGIASERLQGIVSLGMQTNATLVTDEWIEVLKRRNVMVGVSIDGPPEIHNLVRLDHAGKGSYDQTVDGLVKLQNAKVMSGALTVINPGYSGIDIYRHMRSLGIKSMNFLLPDVTHDSKQTFYKSFGATPVADYLIPIFDEWFAEDDPSVQIRLFVGILRSLMGGVSHSEAVGNRPENYLVIDTDGNIQANDVLKVCEEGLSESGLNVSQHGFDDLHLGLPLVYRLVHEGIPLSNQCHTCPERDVCGGGSVPNRYARANGFDNPSVWCEDLLKLLAHIRSQIQYGMAA